MFCIRMVFWMEGDEIVCKQFCLSSDINCRHNYENFKNTDK